MMSDPACPAVRVSLPPGPAGRKETAGVSTFRGDGWLTANDEPTLIRVASGGAQVLATIYAEPHPARFPPRACGCCGWTQGAMADLRQARQDRCAS
jgi:hypothetical protein